MNGRVKPAWLFAVMIFSGVAPAWAALDEAAMRACSGLAQPSQRLGCYDRLLPPPAAPAASVPAVAAPVDAVASFGLPELQVLRKTEATAAPRELRAHVAALQHLGNGGLRLTLDNGQVWAQIAPSERLYVQANEAVVVKAAALRSFILTDASGHSARVHRVQ